MTIGSILGNSFFGNKLIINNKRTYVNRFFIFGNVFLFGVSVLMLEYYYYGVVIKYNYGVFDEMSIMELVIK